VKTCSRPSSARAACPSATSRARRTADRRGGTAARGVAGRICLISTTTRTAWRCYNQISGSERPRGGAWGNNPINLRAANRNNNTPDNHNQNVGFRLATHPACPARCRAVAVRGAGRLRQHKKGASSGPGRGLGPGQRTPRRQGQSGQATVPAQNIRARRTPTCWRETRMTLAIPDTAEIVVRASHVPGPPQGQWSHAAYAASSRADHSR